MAIQVRHGLPIPIGQQREHHQRKEKKNNVKAKQQVSGNEIITRNTTCDIKDFIDLQYVENENLNDARDCK